MEEVNDIITLQKQAKIAPLILFGGLGLLPAIQSSFGMSFIITAVPYYSDPKQSINEAPLTEAQISWFASTTAACVMFGTLISSFSIDRWGRKRSLLISVLMQLFAWGILQISQEFPSLIVNRILVGISSGITSPSTMALLSDISTIGLRGSLGVLIFMVINLGFMVCLALAAILDFQTSIKVFSTPMLIFLAFFAILPESPVWLVKSGKIDEAEQVLRRIRGPDYSVGAEIKEMREMQRVEEKTEKSRNKGFSHLAIFAPTFIKPFGIMALLIILQANIGMDLLCYYAIEILSDIRLPIDRYAFALLMQMDTTMGYLISVAIAARIGRRKHFLTAATILTLCMAASAWAVMGESKEIDDFQMWVVSTALLLIAFCYGLGVGPVIFSQLGEVFPPDLKGAGCGIVFGLRSVSLSVTLKMFHTLRAAIGLSGIFLLNSMIGLSAVVFAYFFQPETHGVSSSEIAKIFATKSDRTISNRQEAGQIRKSSFAVQPKQ